LEVDMSAATRGTSRAASRLILTLAFVLLACAVASGGAAAGGTQPTGSVSGEYAWNKEDPGTTCIPVDELVLRCTTPNFVSDYTGDLFGTARAEFVQTIDCAKGSTTGHGTETFAGSIKGGAAVKLRWRIFFVSDFDCEHFYPYNFRGLGVVSQWGGILKFDDTTYTGWLR
jgi:hypothetical protein